MSSNPGPAPYIQDFSLPTANSIRVAVLKLSSVGVCPMLVFLADMGRISFESNALN